MFSLVYFYGLGYVRVLDLIVIGLDDDGVKLDFVKDFSIVMGYIGGDDFGDMYVFDDLL